MISFVLMVALVAFAAGAAAAVFLMLFTAIRGGDRPERILGNPNAPLDAAARAVLGSRTWPNTPVYRPGPDDD
jgi:hypothetical protein